MDYILFVHGVNTREQREKPAYADDLIRRINHHVGSSKTIKSVPLYWGDVNIDAEHKLLSTLQASSIWNQMWFRKFRENQLLQFAGDSALYISRYIGAKVVSQLKQQALDGLKDYESDDRLHLVTHSMGTVILFDILFASRWDSKDVPGHDDVIAIRDTIYGISGANSNALTGMQLASINTMGSPIAIFSLTDVNPGKDDTEGTPSKSSSHDITPRLQKLLENLQQVRGGKKLPWRNFIHPGDPIAYPLNELMSSLVDGDKKYLDIQDIVIQQAGFTDLLTKPISQTALALVRGGDTHVSYWQSEEVAKKIAETISMKVGLGA
ncbi:MAG: hypothetical protein DSM106950_43130 [Stigonema ocellatum SAG 48.90 = DSM 106950]|nr:hypothetical protein [Stigonema ocellatum SAG 48.90 = DSM 106950]